MRLPLGSCLFLLLVLTALPADAHAQRTRTLRGKVVALSPVAFDSIRLRVGGAATYGTPDVRRSGEFSQEIPPSVATVTIEVQGTALKVLYPPGGQVPVPAGDEQVVVMIGEPVEKVVTRALAERRRQTSELLAAAGVQAQQLTGIEDGIQQILAKLDLKESDLRDEVARKERQAHAYPKLTEAVNLYVLEATDLHTTLALLEPLIERNPQEAWDAIHLAVVAYDSVYQRLRTGRGELEMSLQRDWPDGGLARRELDALLDDVIEATHRRHIVSLNDALVTIQDGLFRGRRDERYRQALADLSRRLRDLGNELDLVKTRASRTLERLRPS